MCAAFKVKGIFILPTLLACRMERGNCYGCFILVTLLAKSVTTQLKRL